MPIYKLFVSIFHFWYQYNTASIWDDVKNGEPPLKIYLWQKTVENCTGCYISLPSHEEGHWKWDLRIHWKRVWNKLKYWNKSLARGELILQILEEKWLSHKKIESMSEDWLGMQILNFRYANMDFFKTPHLNTIFGRKKNRYANMNFLGLLFTPAAHVCNVNLEKCRYLHKCR